MKIIIDSIMEVLEWQHLEIRLYSMVVILEFHLNLILPYRFHPQGAWDVAPPFDAPAYLIVVHVVLLLMTNH